MIMKAENIVKICCSHENETKKKKEKKRKIEISPPKEPFLILLDCGFPHLTSHSLLPGLLGL
jgi:hypothetical protein